MRSERQTRQEKIDLQLGRAGWALGSRRLIAEFLVGQPFGVQEPTNEYKRVNEFADYALLDRLNRPLAVVEAKRSSRDPLEGERQAADYADALHQVRIHWGSAERLQCLWPHQSERRYKCRKMDGRKDTRQIGIDRARHKYRQHC